MRKSVMSRRVGDFILFRWWELVIIIALLTSVMIVMYEGRLRGEPVEVHHRLVVEFKNIEDFRDMINKEDTEEVEEENATAGNLYKGGVLSKSNMTVEELEKGLLYDLKPLAKDFLKVEEEEGVNALFFSALCAYESGWGREHRNNNLGGWGNYKYESKQDFVYRVGKLIKDNYLTEGGVYFNGYEVEDVNKEYNKEIGAEWGRNVRKLMKEIEFRGKSL